MGYDRLDATVRIAEQQHRSAAVKMLHQLGNLDGMTIEIINEQLHSEHGEATGMIDIEVQVHEYTAEIPLFVHKMESLDGVTIQDENQVKDASLYPIGG